VISQASGQRWCTRPPPPGRATPLGGLGKQQGLAYARMGQNEMAHIGFRGLTHPNRTRTEIRAPSSVFSAGVLQSNALRERPHGVLAKPDVAVCMAYLRSAPYCQRGVTLAMSIGCLCQPLNDMAASLSRATSGSVLGASQRDYQRLSACRKPSYPKRCSTCSLTWGARPRAWKLAWVVLTGGW